jgi:hypothetical protein
MKWLRIPEKIVRQALKEHKEKTGNDFSCVWPQDSELGVYLQDFNQKMKLDYQASYLLLRQLLEPFGYDINDCDAIYYTTSKFFIILWEDNY